MNEWHILLEIVVLLAAALFLGTLAERLKQSAIVGYLLAGTIVGPHVLQLVKEPGNVETIAELGVSLLLLTIGLEFSVRRLLRLGRLALLGGTLQVVVTMLATALGASVFGLSGKAALIVGAIVALSSTACVIRLLVDRQALDSVYGRGAVGILLLQDAAVLPLTVIVSALSVGGSAGEVFYTLGKTALFAVGLIGGFYVIFTYIVPRLLNLRQWARNRELPILLAIVVAMGSTIAAHHIHISPAIGAFIAGLMLAESPFATQIRADLAALRTVLVTLFFASVGMLANPGWAIEHAHWVLLLVVSVVAGKALIITVIARILSLPRGTALATGMCLAQIGEFSFVLATIASTGPRGHGEGGQGAAAGPLTQFQFDLIIAATFVTLLLTPYLVKLAPLVADRLDRTTPIKPKAPKGESAPPGDGGAAEPAEDESMLAETPSLTKCRILLVGFGPAAQQVATALMATHREHLLVMDLNPRNAQVARQFGLNFQVGDARQADVLEHAHVDVAEVVIVTLPDANAARQVIHLVRHINPSACVIVRARYHVTRWELALAGASVVIDEEEQMGMRLAAEARRALGLDDDSNETTDASGDAPVV